MREVDRVPPDGVRPERAEVRRAVLAAAAEVFREEGFHGATTEGIARRAGFSKGALYSNFEGKTDLFLALLADEALARSGRAAVTAADTEAASLEAPDVEERRRRSARATALGILDLAADRRPIMVLAEFRSHVAHEPDDSLRAGRSRAEMVGALAHWLDDAIRRRGLRTVVPVEEVATVLLALVSGLALEGRSPGNDSLVSAETLTAVLTGLVRPAEGQPAEAAS